MTPPSPQDEPRPRRMPTDELYLDAKNPRLLAQGGSQRELLETMWRDFVAEEVALSIAKNGFWEYEPLIVARENNRLIVIEGNRRLAAVKLLLDDTERKRVGATSLPVISGKRRDELQSLPVILTTRSDVWQYVGYKHVNGPQAWQSYSKAQYIAWVHNELQVPLDQIAETIGDKHATVQRLYRSLMVLEQAERNSLWQREDRVREHFSFSHLYTGLNSYSGIQKYIGVDQAPNDSADPVNQDHFDQLQQLLIWLYGSKSRDELPVIRSQNPDLRQLDKVLTNANSTAALQSGLPLAVAVDVAKGDAAKLREDLVIVRRLLQDCRGKVLTGFTGESDLLELAQEIFELSEAITDDMISVQRRNRRTRRASS
jgi:hypothetical protein